MRWKEQTVHDSTTDLVKPHRWGLSSVSFSYYGRRYEGDGWLDWDPATGFRLEVNHARRKGAALAPAELYTERAVEERDFTSFRMECPPFIWAVAPRIFLGNRLGLFEEGSLVVETDRVLFLARPSPILLPGSPLWEVSGLIALPSRVLLPEWIETVVRVKEAVVEERSCSGAISWESRGDRILARRLDDEWATVHVVRGGRGRGRRQILRWPQAFCDAVSMLHGTSIPMIAYSRRYYGRELIDVRTRRPFTDLGALSPFRWSDPSMPRPEHTLALADYLSVPSAEALVCQRLLETLISAAGQKSVEVMMLLAATALEAAMRTLYGWPFHDKRRTGVVLTGLRKFCSEHGLLNHSVVIADTVCWAHTQLRDRNAHPDWLRPEVGDTLDSESYSCLLYLARFYGFMIGALAEIEALSNPFKLLPGQVGLSPHPKKPKRGRGN